MPKDKSPKKTKEKEPKNVKSKASKDDLKKKTVKKPVISTKEILANGLGKDKPTPAKSSVAKLPPRRTDDSDESSEDSSENEDLGVSKTKAKRPAITKAAIEAAIEDDHSSDSSSSSEDEKSKVSQVNAAAKQAMSSSSESSEDERTAKVAPKATSKAASTVVPKGAAKKIEAKPASSSSSESSEDDGVAITQKPSGKAPKAEKGGSSGTKGSTKLAAISSTTKGVPASGATQSSDSSEDSDSDSEEKVPGVKPLATKTSESTSNSASESDDSDEDGDVEMKDATALAATNGKRKAEDDASGPVKKVKVSTPGDDATSSESKTLFVGQLSWNVDNDWLSTEFAEAGEVISARVQMDRQSGRSRGFGYVEFATAAAAKAALEKFQGKEIDGRAIKLDFSQPRQPNPAGRAKQFGDAPSEPSSTLFVGNISWNTTEDMLWEHFGQYGDITSVRVPTDRDSGKPKGYGYVQYTDPENAKKGYEGAQGSEIDGRHIRLDYSQPKESTGGRGGFGGGSGGFGGGRGFGGDRGGRGDGRRFGDRGGRGGGRGFDRGGRGGRGRGGPRGGARTGGITSFEGRKKTFD